MRRMIQVLEAAVDAPTETHVLMYWALEELIYLERASRANRNRAFLLMVHLIVLSTGLLWLG